MIKRYALLVAVVLGGIGLAALTLRAQAGMFYPVQLLDFNPVLPLENPDPLQSQPRYVSGFGQDDEFTVFFEDRSDNGRIYFVTTTSGPTGFPITPTATNVTDTHFLVKDWPVTVEGTTYAYRAWASVGNNPDHHFYVSNNLTDWTLISTFTITNKPPITDSVFGHVYYGFHDVIQIIVRRHCKHPVHRGHDVPHGTVSELEDVFDDVLFLVVQFPTLRSLFHQSQKLIFPESPLSGRRLASE